VPRIAIDCGARLSDPEYLTTTPLTVPQLRVSWHELSLRPLPPHCLKQVAESRGFSLHQAAMKCLRLFLLAGASFVSTIVATRKVGYDSLLVTLPLDRGSKQLLQRKGRLACIAMLSRFSTGGQADLASRSVARSARPSKNKQKNLPSSRGVCVLLNIQISSTAPRCNMH